MFVHPEIRFDSELDPLVLAVSELLSCDFHHVADRMSQLSDEERDAVDYLDYVPAERANFIHRVVRDMVACGKFDASKQEDWAGACAGVLFTYVYTPLRNTVVIFAKLYDVAINYLAYHDHAKPDTLFGHDVYGACYRLIDRLMDAGDITAAAFCDAWCDGCTVRTVRMIDLLGFDVDLFERTRGLQYSSLNGYTLADIEYELAR